MVRLRRLSLLSPVSGSRHGGIVSLGAAKLRRLLSPADRGPRAMAPPPASAPSPPRLPRGDRRAVLEPPCPKLGPPRGFPAATGCAPRSLPGSAGGSQAPAGAAVPGVRGLPPRRDLLGRAAVLGAAPAGRLLAAGSGEKGRAPRGVAPTAAGRPGRGARAVCEARGARQWPGAFPAAGAGRFCGGRREPGRALQRGAADRAFPPRWGEPPPGRARGCRAAASWVARTKGPRRERAGAPPLLPGCQLPRAGWRWGCSSRSPPVRPPRGVRLQPPRGQLLPRSRLRNLLCRCLAGGAGGVGNAPPRDTRGGGRLAWSGAGWAQAARGEREAKAVGGCVCLRGGFCAQKLLRTNFKQFK